MGKMGQIGADKMLQGAVRALRGYCGAFLAVMAGGVVLWAAGNASAATALILAGDEFGLPEDRPSLRLDPETSGSPFSFVGALEVTSAGGRTFLGSAVALSSQWVLTAGQHKLCPPLFT